MPEEQLRREQLIRGAKMIEEKARETAREAGVTLTETSWESPVNGEEEPDTYQVGFAAKLPDGRHDLIFSTFSGEALVNYLRRIGTASIDCTIAEAISKLR